MRKILTSAVVLGSVFAAGQAFSGATGNVDADVNATVNADTISITKNTDLQLGSLTPTGANGTVRVEGNSHQGASNVTAGGSPSSATFSVTGLEDGHQYSFTIDRSVRVGKDGTGTTLGTDAFLVGLYEQGGSVHTPQIAEVTGGTTHTFNLTPTGATTLSPRVDGNVVGLGQGLEAGSYSSSFNIQVDY